jgi:rfaE bifunctional protein nucleotidyltransferase chain/domain
MSKVVKKFPEREIPLSQEAEASARAKIKPLDELVDIVAEAQARGLRVVLAHGTFDLLHMGHVRHLEQARAEGDVLIVTITGDAYVNKGPGRPVFTAPLRAEMLAALGYVDWVAVNEAPTAENVIGALKPDVYAKGSDYAEAENDTTGKIVDERTSVEAGGGRILFTDDITFSSSSLLNRFFDIHDPKLRGYLELQRERDIADKLLGMIEGVRDYKVLLVGDTIIDEYHYVAPLGKSPKENLIATQYRDRELFAGGVIAAANHVAGFCREVEVLTCLGEVDSCEDLVLASLKPNVKMTAIRRPGVPTTRKSRFVDSDYLRKLFEVYYMDDSHLIGQQEQDFAASIRERAGDFDLVIVTDFGHGLITRKSIDALSDSAKFLAINAQSNSANQGYNLVTKYPWADYICIDAPEAKLAVADKFGDLGLIASKVLPEQVACDRMILTHGRYGCVTYDRSEGVHHIPAFTGQALDTLGAGDAFLAVTSPLVASGADMDLVGFIGNAVGAMKVGIVGHRESVEKVPLVRYLQTLLK